MGTRCRWPEGRSTSRCNKPSARTRNRRRSRSRKIIVECGVRKSGQQHQSGTENLYCPYGHVVHKRHDVPLPPEVSTINFQLNFHCLPHFYELLLVVARGLVVLPELVDVDVADRDDQNVAAVDHREEYSIEKNVEGLDDSESQDIPTEKDRSMGGW